MTMTFQFPTFARPLLAAAFGWSLAAAGPARASEHDGFVMGAGSWDCAEVIAHWDADHKSEVGQIVGWILGFWSAATYARETGFVDTVEQVGGRTIFEQTLDRCRTAPEGAKLYVVTRSMIANTK
ncbi:MAG: 5'-methylthioadenosine phosphorylase [Maritimibacter sp.]|nr:5'-methylthioadenosine phosphorylase [Maritimibacter sp.]